MTHFSVTFISLSSSIFFRDATLDSASFDSATKSDLQATGIDLKNNFKKHFSGKSNGLAVVKYTALEIIQK